MNEYQQALVRIIELEDRNAELLEALEQALRYASNTWDIECAPLWVEQATEAIRKGELT